MFEKDFVEFNTEMARLKEVTWQGYAKTLKEVGIAYLGNVNHSAKLSHGETINMHTYGVYLSPGNLSGFEVCPKSVTCRDTCLYGSGHNRLAHFMNSSKVDNPRVIKTRLFFANRKIFMLLLIHEIEVAKANAERKGYNFSVRLNCTSDLNISLFKYEGVSICHIFPDVQFYDYTKVPAYLSNPVKFHNYHLTFSYDGTPENFAVCKGWLQGGGNVAVVFGVLKKEELPKTWLGYKVLCGDDYDYRPWDEVVAPDAQIVGLVYKTNVNDYEVMPDNSRKFKGVPESVFIVPKGSEDCEW